jgi:DNA-binding winged helix-turn-helix (wHTH) protein
VAALIPADQVPDGATVLGTMMFGPEGVGEAAEAAGPPDRSFDDVGGSTDQSYGDAPVTLSADGDVTVDLASRTVVVRGRTLTLTRLEFDLLAVLVATPRRVHTRAQLHESVWEGISSGGPRTVDVHVHRLRHKLGPAHEQHLVTVRGVGYRWDPKPEPRRQDRRTSQR